MPRGTDPDFFEVRRDEISSARVFPAVGDRLAQARRTEIESAGTSGRRRLAPKNTLAGGLGQRQLDVDHPRTICRKPDRGLTIFNQLDLALTVEGNRASNWLDFDGRADWDVSGLADLSLAEQAGAD